MEDKNVNGYEYIIRDNGTVTAKGYLQDETASRKGMSSIESAGEGYQKGHLIAARENGAIIEENIFSQDAGLNQGRYKKMENAEMRLIQKDSAQVFTEKTAFISNHSKGLQRPDVYMINDTIFYPNGDMNTVHLSFANMSTSEQELLNEESALVAFDTDIENPGDTLRERMTDEEYTELMELTDENLLNIDEEYTQHVENVYEDTNLDSKNIAIEYEACLDDNMNIYGESANNSGDSGANNSMGDMDMGIDGE